MIYALFGVAYRKDPILKEALLRRFQKEGYWLMDAVEHPINRLDSKGRDIVITSGITELVARLEGLRARRILDDSSGIVLLKKNVWQILATRLPQHGFTVLNRTRYVGFPGWHRDERTVTAIREAIGAGPQSPDAKA